MAIPNDPVILLSYINTQLRDFYPSLTELSKAMDIDAKALKSKLASIEYHYDEQLNQFIQ